MRFFASFQQHRIFGGAVVLALTQFVASVAGLFRERVLFTTFPPEQGISDVYLASFRPSDLLFQITIMAGLSTVLVPLLSRYKADNNTKDMSKLLSSVMAVGSTAFGIIALLLAIGFPWIAPKLVQFEGEQLELYIQFGRLALFTNFLFVFGNAFGQYLITIQRYWIYGITPVLYTLGTIFGTIYLTPVYGAMGPMLGTLGGAVVYVIIRFAGSFGSGFRFRGPLWHPDLLTMGWLMLPRMAALGALQLELLLFDTVASGLDKGSVVINAAARNFQSVAVGIVGIALAQSAFSLLSQAAAKKEMNRFWIYMKKGTGLILLLTIPGAILLVLVTPIAASLVGLQSVLPAFALALGMYAISIPFESTNHLLLRSYYALQSTGIPALWSVLNGFIAIAVSWYLAPKIGVHALALGFTVGQIVQLIGLSVLLPRTARRKVTA